MLGKSKTDTYYAISARYNFEQRKVVAIICETDGIEKFEFIASYENTVDPEILSLLKKAKGYGFSADEITELKEKYTKTLEKTIKSILAENNIDSNDVDFICLDNLEVAKNCKIDIASSVFKQLNIPVIYDVDLEDKSEFLQVLTNSKSGADILINLDEDFEIFKINDTAHLVDKSIGFSSLRYLAVYLNVERDQISYLIAQGTADEALINKLANIEKLEDLQKELINLIVLSKLSTEDKLKTAFMVLNSLLLKNLGQFDMDSKIMLIGNTTLVEELNQNVKSVFENVEFLKNQSQRQDTFTNEHMAHLATKKYALENYNNGVQIS
tara:strand:- start:3383 stop:4360 length:978 start_codon:yes stop_codon:yes gene_type:complete